MDIKQCDKDIAGKNSVLSKALQEYYIFAESGVTDEQEKTVRIGNLITHHAVVLSAIDSCMKSLFEEYDLTRSKDIVQDFLGTITNFLAISLPFQKIVRSNLKGSEESPLSPRAYYTIQKFINSYAPEERTTELKKKFEAAGTDTSGFDEKFGKSKMQQKNDNKKATSIWMGAVSVAVVLGIYLFGKNIDPYFRNVLQALFALGCGGLSAALLGSLTINVKSYGIDAIGGFAVAILVFFFPPNITQPDFRPIVILRDPQDRKISGDDIKLSVTLEGMSSEGHLVSESKAYQFDNLNPKFLNADSIELNLTSGKWVFTNSRDNRRIHLSDKEISVHVIRDSASLTTSGHIEYPPIGKKGRPVIHIYAQANPAISTYADTTGNFSLKMPDNYEEESVRLVIKADGYKDLEVTPRLKERNGYKLTPKGRSKI